MFGIVEGVAALRACLVPKEGVAALRACLVPTVWPARALRAIGLERPEGPR